MVLLTLYSLLNYFDILDFLTLESMQANVNLMQNWFHSFPYRFTIVYTLVIILISSVSIPIIGLAALTSGFIYGIFIGPLIVSTACGIGGTVAMLSARYLIRDTVTRKLAHQIKRINSLFENGYFLPIFTIRLLPIFPFTIVNLVLGITDVKIKTYLPASIIGTLPIVTLFSIAGKELSTLNHIQDILSPSFMIILGSITAISVIAIIIKHRSTTK